MLTPLLENRFIDGRKVKSRILHHVSEYVKEHTNNDMIGKLVSVTIGDTPEVDVYVRNQKKAAEKVGIRFEICNWNASASQEEVKKKLQSLNDDQEVLGVIIQRPIPKHINIQTLQSAIHPLKDIEGMNPASIGNIVYSDIAMAPCTAAASVELLKETGLTMKGLEVVMIGHSEIVGKPAAFLMMAEGATVTVCHHMTRSVAMHSRRADAVVVAVGKPNFLGPEMIKPGAAVIDIGINQVLDADGNTKIVGDCDTYAVKEVAGWITPVPGGVGPVTVAMLMKNAISAHKKQLKAGWLTG
jgi:methylenetetrahydrofolate dehydrogenase (NADP+)/methenyltetrahydrofolate cyclohydrolase